MVYQSPTHIEINLKALKRNLSEITKLAQKNASLPFVKNSSASIMAVVKADAYGHGMVEVARCLSQNGVKFFAVSDLKEGIELRQARVGGKILLFESLLDGDAGEIVKYQLTPTICTFKLAQEINRIAMRQKKDVGVHIKIDTGMGRLGVPYKDAFSFIKRIAKLERIKIEGLYTHFPVADTNARFTQMQIKKLTNIIEETKTLGVHFSYVHASNSAGLLNQKTNVLNFIRTGIMLYGLTPDGKKTTKVKLEPVMSVKSKVIFLKDLEKGEGVSYGRTFIARRRTKVAIIPIGYANGYFRTLSNKGCVLIGGKQCPVLGNVTMDQIVVDVSRVRNIKIGSPAVILGTQGDKHISAEDLAQIAKTINYEVICNLGRGNRREYLRSS